MQIAYLKNVNENCYPDKHISDDFTNAEQVDLCKNEQYNEVWGTFNERYETYRESDIIRYNHCQTDSGQDMKMSFKCVQTYNKNVLETNKTLSNILAQTNKEYL